MPLAIILVCTSTGTETHVLKNLKNSKGVLEVFPVNGAYDLVVKVKTETFDMLRECIAKIKQSLPKMQNMVTMLVVENNASTNGIETKTLKQKVGD